MLLRMLEYVFFIVMAVLCAVAIGWALVLLSLAEFSLPFEMKMIYRMTRKKLHEIGWG